MLTDQTLSHYLEYQLLVCWPLKKMQDNGNKGKRSILYDILQKQIAIRTVGMGIQYDLAWILARSLTPDL